MGESQAFSAASMIVDDILTQGGDKLYSDYISGQLRPYSAAKCRILTDKLYSYIKMTQDKEVPSGKVFDELWTDDGEPIPAEKPLWMGGIHTKIFKQSHERPAHHLDSNRSRLSSRRKKNSSPLQKWNSSMYATYDAGPNTIFSIQTTGPAGKRLSLRPVSGNPELSLRQSKDVSPDHELALDSASSVSSRVSPGRLSQRKLTIKNFDRVDNSGNQGRPPVAPS